VNTALDPNDPTTWPVADAEPTDTFLGAAKFQRQSQPTAEQAAWPVADAVPTELVLSPVLELTLSLSANASRVELATALVNLLRELSATEERLGGTGLVLVAEPDDKSETVCLRLHPKRLVGARTRLDDLARAIARGAEPSVSSAAFATCRARVTVATERR
jgi:hypothetical protein